MERGVSKMQWCNIKMKMHKNGLPLCLRGKVTEGKFYFPEKRELLRDLSLGYPGSWGWDAKAVFYVTQC